VTPERIAAKRSPSFTTFACVRAPVSRVTSWLGPMRTTSVRPASSTVQITSSPSQSAGTGQRS